MLIAAQVDPVIVVFEELVKSTEPADEILDLVPVPIENDERVPPKMEAVAMVVVAIRMDDGSLKSITISDDRPKDFDAIGSFRDYHEDNMPHEESIDPEQARWAVQWIACSALAVMGTLTKEGEICAW